MSRLLFLLTTSLFALGCGEDVCGPMNASEFGLMVSGESANLVFGELIAGANNDCPDPGAPVGVISLTIAGTLNTGNGLVTFCVPRPDLLATSAQPFGTSVHVIDLNASDAACTYSLDRARPVSGTVTSNGMCGNGTDRRGFSITFDGAASLKRTCGSATDSVEVELRGQVAVAAS